MDAFSIEPVADIRTDFTTKFGLPRQSGLVPGIGGVVVMRPGYRDAMCFRGLEGYSHIWLLWLFSENAQKGWSPTVLPPRLGGKTRMGVFATRSPFRPNSIGLSCVRLDRVELSSPEGPRLYVSGADLMNGTPIIDIKPYLPFADSVPDASAGFAGKALDYSLEVVFPDALLSLIPERKRAALIAALSEDPRPAYQNDETRRYGFEYAGFDVRFHVRGGVLTVCEVVPLR